MRSSRGSVRTRRIDASLLDDATGPPLDYADAFEVTTRASARLTAEQWAHAIFTEAPAPLRLLLTAGWSTVLRLRLGPRSPDHVLGWRIVSATPDVVRLELLSPLMKARLVISREPEAVAFATRVYYRNSVAHPIWAMVGIVHRQLVPLLLSRAAIETERTA